MKKIISALILALILASCSGYQIGDMGHPQIKKISIGKLKNLSQEPRMGLFMMEKLKEKFRQDGTYRIVNFGEKADAVLTGTITNFDVRGVSAAQSGDDDDRYRADTFRGTVYFEYEVKTAKNLLIQEGKESAYADFSETIGIDQERRSALRRACFNLSGKVVTNIAEGW